MTELYIIQDKSPGFQDTWQFLDRRLEEGIHIQELLADTESNAKQVKKTLGSVFSTVSLIRNLLFSIDEMTKAFSVDFRPEIFLGLTLIVDKDLNSRAMRLRDCMALFRNFVNYSEIK